MKYFWPKLLNKLGLLDKINLYVKVNVNNKQFIIPIIKKIGFTNIYPFEEWMKDILKKIGPLMTGVFVDVGVNIGQSLLKLRSVNTSIKYIGLEPNPNCVFYTNELIISNKFENTELYPVGISTNDSIISLNMYSSDELDSSASIIENFREQKIIKKIHVPIFKAQTIAKSGNIFDDISVIKIDVEGAELEVLLSFEDVIKKCKPIILIEILPVYSETNIFRKERQLQIEKLIKKYDYVILRVEKNKDDSLKELVPIEEIGIHSDISKCDYVFISNLKLNEINL